MNKLRLFITIVLLSITCINSYAARLHFTTQEKKILQNLSEEIKMIKSAKSISINLEYRLFELYIERNKIIFNAENRNYIQNVPISTNKNKLHFFPLSYKNYQHIHKLGLSIAINYPLFFANDQIFYAIAMMSKDFEGDKFTKLYLKKALKLTKNKELKYKIYTGLAEFYFNHKKYKTAGYYFKQAIKFNTPWTTKHLYNLAWCQHMRKQYNRALQTLLQAFKVSNKKGFVNINEQILKSAIPFFIQTKKINEAISFFTQNSNQADEYLLKLAKRTEKNGDWQATLLVINKLNELTPYPHKSFNTIKKFELQTYLNFKKEKLFFKVAKDLKELKLRQPKFSPSEDIVILLEKRNEHLQKLQVALYTYNQTINKQRNRDIMTYFQILEVINPTKACIYEFHYAENFFFTKNYISAVDSYKKSLQLCQAPENKEYILKNINALLGSATYLKKTSIKQAQQVQILAYNQYLKYWSHNQTAKTYLEELFKIYFKQQNITMMNKTFFKYQSLYPHAHKKNRLMLLNITDYYIKHKNADNISRIIQFAQKKKISLTPKKLEQITFALGTIIFNKLDQSKDRAQMIEGLKQVYSAKLYPQKIKVEATLKLATLYIEQNDFNNYLHWIKNFNKLSTLEQKKKNRSIVFSTIQKLYLTEQLTTLERLFQQTYHYCSIFNKQQRYLMLTGHKDYLLDTHADITPENFEQNFHLDKCILASQQISNLKKDIYSFYIFEQNIARMLSWAKDIAPNDINAYYALHIDQLWQQAQHLTLQEMISRLNKINGLFINYLSDSLFQETKEQFQALYKCQDEFRLLNQITLPTMKVFNEEKFNHNLERFISDVTNHANNITTLINHLPAAIAVSYLQKLASNYQQKRNLLINYPLNVQDKNYRNSIKQVLRQLAYPFYKNAKKFRKLANRSKRAIKEQDKLAYWEGRFDTALAPMQQITANSLSYDITMGGQ